MFFSTVYIQVRKNQFHLRRLESDTELTVVALEPFTTSRCLIGQFCLAEKLLQGAIKRLPKNRFLAVALRIVIHPVEMVEGGLSEVEERVFREIALGARASKVLVWVGDALSDAEVRDKLRQ
jgi:rod shape-determining protein MreB